MPESDDASHLPSHSPSASVPPSGRERTVSAGLCLVATPIGNLADISTRAITTLREADLILCEDTRTSASLLRQNGISAPLMALHDHNEDARIPIVLARLAAGERIALISDAGTPLVSDPGYRLVRAAVAAGVRVSGVPGPNAAVLALTLSGLPPLPFLFAGFPPPRESARRAHFGQLRAAEQNGLSATMIWHEAPHRLAEMLADLLAVFGDRPASVARELTKRFEEVRRDPVSALLAHYRDHAARGEITVVLGPPAPENASTADLDAQLRRALADNSVKDAAALVAAATGLPRRAVYSRALELAAE